MYKILSKNDISTRNFNVSKNWSFDETTIDNYGIVIQYGISGSSTFYTSSEPTNSDGSYQRLIYASVQHLYYPTQSKQQPLHFQAYTRNFINLDKIAIISRSLQDVGIGIMNVPVTVFGEKIKPGTFLLETSSTRIIDDNNYNIYISGSNPRTIIGNIFYEQGHVIITSQSYTSSFDVFDLSFQSIHRIYENEVFLEVGNSEFNYTTNPSSYHSDSVHYIPAFSASLINPYITSVGLFNDLGELLVVGKLPRSFKKSD